MRVNRGVLRMEPRWFQHFRAMGLATLALLLTSFVGTAFGQTTTGTITGTVTDQQGAAIVGANVVVRNTDTGAANTVRTNDSGSYTAPPAATRDL